MFTHLFIKKREKKKERRRREKEIERKNIKYKKMY